LAPRISLALALHNHQPVGNFGWVFADVYEQAYRPMLDALDRHSGVRLALHYTGPLLDWLRSERPEFVERLAALVARGQVELMGGGYYEPVLASIPERDRLGQLRTMADEVERIAGRRPRGAWLAERVWEPDLPTSLAAAGYQWTILDDNHFRAAAIPEEKLWGPYTTDDQGALLTIFGTEKGLRYRIPFGTVEDVIVHLRDNATEAGDRVGMMGDDGEKFGSWPTTWEHCWGASRWVDRFFEALEANDDWLTTVTPSDWLDRNPPVGRVYVPAASYAEMGEWALPPDESRVFADLLHRAEASAAPEYRFLRGGFWRNFQVKYREVNDLHKQMLRTSAKVAAMPPGEARARALAHLYQGQSNDCYWHGLFGGIYISHMRLATYEHLIAAEDVADRAARAAGQAVDGAAQRDVDLDGIDEAVLTTPGSMVVIKVSEGAGIGSWDIRAVRHALTAVLRRRPEASHETLVEHERRLAEVESVPGATGVGSIHDMVATKETGLTERLHYDGYERRSALVHLWPPRTTPGQAARAETDELADLVKGSWTVLSSGGVDGDAWLRLGRDGVFRGEAGPQAIRAEMMVTAAGGRRTPTLEVATTLENRSSAGIETLLGLEWALTMLGGGGNPAAFWDLDGERVPHDSAGSRNAISRLRSGNDYIGIELETRVDPPADAWIAPIETVSNSEAGFERVYQGSALVLARPVALAPGERTTVTVRHAVHTSRDRAEEEDL
jgi:4-alpha-glucanotransferase